MSLAPSMDTEFLKVEEQLVKFAKTCRNVERTYQKLKTTVPSDDSKREVARAYWDVFNAVEAFQLTFPNDDLTHHKQLFRNKLMPLLGRCKYTWRSLYKPNGYAGDFRIIDWMYHLENSAGNDPTQPALINCLEYVFSTNHSVIGLWERRRWLIALLKKEFKQRDELKILDIACGGARYLKDFMDKLDSPEKVKITLLDQDPSALAFAEHETLSNYVTNMTFICEPIKLLPKVLPEEKFDVIISSGLFDYLPHKIGSSMLATLTSRLSKNGVLAITNFHVNDKSAISKDWGSDWQLIFRTEEEVEAMYPENLTVNTRLSECGSLVMAHARSA